jgi:L-gulonolactone oxidase
MSVLAVGLGRSYGDSGLNLDQAVIDMSHLDRVLAFDPATGVLRGEAGLSLSEIIRRVVPLGWFLPTTPGTRFVTLGGAVANDVHGKNHHRAATFGAWVRRLGLWRSDQGEMEISPAESPELFAATVGGVGLTGVILWVELQLVRIGGSRLDTETIPFANCDEFLEIARESEASFEHTVAWVDCSSRKAGLGRGIFTRGNWRADGVLTVHDDRRRAVLPMDLPGFALNPVTLSAFNALYYHLGASGPRHGIQTYAQAFHPLDTIGGWNRLYGPRGFFQFQCVTPMEAGMAPVANMLSAIAATGEGSFLAVLKTFGDKPSPGLLSFPRRGVTLAMDFANRGPATLALLARLDAIAAAAGGRLYPAKDGRMSPAMFKGGYPQLSRFIDRIDPAFSSSFWRRIHHG